MSRKFWSGDDNNDFLREKHLKVNYSYSDEKNKIETKAKQIMC
jgi:hypothetical protein